MALDTMAAEQSGGRRTLTLIAATCFLFFMTWAYVFITRQPRVADGAIEAITPVPLHTEFRQGGTMMEGYGGGVQRSDEMYVWVALRARNLTGATPLVETGQRATLTLPTGEQLFANATTASEVAKVRALPRLKGVPGALLPRDLVLKPGESAEGLALFGFAVTPQQWATRREFSVTVGFQGQRGLALREDRTDR